LSGTDRHEISVVVADPCVGRPLETLFHRGGFDRVSAEDRPASAAALEHGPPDLVILDAVMPGPDGFEVRRPITNQAS
jgi:DNA-binding response OmpR family regulator